MGVVRFFYLLLFISLAVTGYSQSNVASAYDHLASAEIQKEHILYLTSGEANGRGAGSRGGFVAREYIEKRFEEYGVERRGLLYSQPFRTNSVTAYNVVGVISAASPTDEYVVVGAHYDHLGEIKGKIYHGADDNASGVAALLELARIFGQMKKDGRHLSKNILFVAFDAKELSMAGSRNFLKTCRITPTQIKCMVNIDQIGSALVPPGNSPNYLLVLGRDSLENWAARQIDLSNRTSHMNMDIDYTFYNSENFSRIFYKLSDHYPFAQKGIPALFFTSGITNHTYKESDTEDKIAYPVLTNRIKLIFHFLYHQVN